MNRVGHQSRGLPDAWPSSLKTRVDGQYRNLASLQTAPDAAE
jgi:hypothetical protein